MELPPSGFQMTGVLLIAIMNTLATAGGIGGGAIMTPFMMIFMGLPITECIPLANSFALISAVTRFLVNFRQKHPFRPWRLVIDYEVVTLTMPIVYLGTMMGVQIGAFMNQEMLMILLGIVLLQTFYLTIKKAIETYKKETLKKNTKIEALI
jgi:uncharacterized membrane protein YfcA